MKLFRAGFDAQSFGDNTPPLSVIVFIFFDHFLYRGFGDLGDILSDLFGMGGGRGRRRRSAGIPGADLRYDLELTFEEAAFGLDREIEYERLEGCERCGGTGARVSPPRRRTRGTSRAVWIARRWPGPLAPSRRRAPSPR